MKSENRATHFAPAGRASPDELARQAEILSDHSFVSKLFDCVQEMVVILNAHRQIVFANPRFLEFADMPSVDSFIGARPGEAVACERTSDRDKAPDGCGTSEACSTCGAVKAILASQTRGAGLEECIIVREGTDSDPLNLRVRTSQIEVGQEVFTVFAMQDISDSKRREALERIFFHDVLNTAGAVRGLAEIFSIVAPEKQEAFRERIRQGADRLIDEINSYRVIAAAERNELVLTLTRIRGDLAIHDVIALFEAHETSAEKQLLIDDRTEFVEFETDPALLSRVLVNMVKNALEATPKGGTVTVGCRTDGPEIRFEVHNPSVIPRDIAMQIFQRSFSTKSAGRGLGTYSMKLIGERYLGGRIGFTTSEAEGTTFHAVFPQVGSDHR